MTRDYHKKMLRLAAVHIGNSTIMLMKFGKE